MTDPFSSLPAEPVLGDELSVVFARMSGLLLSRESMTSAVALVTSLAADTVPGAFGSGVSLLDGRGQRTTAGASVPLVDQADSLQYELDEGPCLTAWARQVVVRMDDTATDTRWPRWASAAAGMGLRSALSAPLNAGGSSLGAIKVYGEQPGAFGERAEDLLVRFGEQASVLLANMQAFEGAQQMSEGLKQALLSRDVISTAKGILMARDGMDADTAFGMLVSASQRQNVKLREIAQQIVSTTVRVRR